MPRTSRSSTQSSAEGSHEDSVIIKCPYHGCTREYSTRYNLQRHINVNHHKIRRYECRICHEKFSFKQFTEDHLLRNHYQRMLDFILSRQQRKVATFDNDSKKVIVKEFIRVQAPPQKNQDGRTDSLIQRAIDSFNLDLHVQTRALELPQKLGQEVGRIANAMGPGGNYHGYLASSSGLSNSNSNGQTVLTGSDSWLTEIHGCKP